MGRDKKRSPTLFKHTNIHCEATLPPATLLTLQKWGHRERYLQPCSHKFSVWNPSVADSLFTTRFCKDELFKQEIAFIPELDKCHIFMLPFFGTLCSMMRKKEILVKVLLLKRLVSELATSPHLVNTTKCLIPKSKGNRTKTL
jgi:hypothetical protein